MSKADFESTVLSDLRDIKKDVTNLDEKVDTLGEILTGNGDTSKGVVVRLANVEQDVKRSKWIERTLLAAILTAIGGGYVASNGSGSSHNGTATSRPAQVSFDR